MIGKRYYINCDSCDCEIEDGDYYYELDGECLCERCAEQWLEEQRMTYDAAGAMTDEAYERSL